MVSLIGASPRTIGGDRDRQWVRIDLSLAMVRYAISQSAMRAHCGT
jgi:hypothetical protein